MRAVNFQTPAGPGDFERWATESFREIERASRMTGPVAKTKIFSAYMSGPATCPVNAITKLPIDTEVADIGNHFDVAAHRYTPPIGAVTFTAQALATTFDPAEIVALRLVKNGATTVPISQNVFAVNGAFYTAQLSHIDYAAGTDYYEVFIYTSPAAATAVVINGNLANTNFAACALE